MFEIGKEYKNKRGDTCVVVMESVYITRYDNGTWRFINFGPSGDAFLTPTAELDLVAPTIYHYSAYVTLGGTVSVTSACQSEEDLDEYFTSNPKLTELKRHSIQVDEIE